jgi:WD40 repeat protein
LQEWRQIEENSMNTPVRLVCFSLMHFCVAMAAAGEPGPTFVFRGHETRVRSVAFSPDGKLLVSRGNDPPIRLWDVVKGDANRVLGEASARYVGAGVSFTSDSQKVIVGAATDEGDTELWDVTPGKPKTRLKPVKQSTEPTEYIRINLPPDKEPLLPRLISPDGKFRASRITYTREQIFEKNIRWQDTSDIVKVYTIRDVSTGEVVPRDEAQEKWLRAALTEMTVGDLKKRDPTASMPAISADRTVLAALGSDPEKKTNHKFILVWEVKSWNRIAAIRQSNFVHTLAVARNSDGIFVAVGCEDTNVRVWKFPAPVDKKGKQAK